MRKLLLSLLLFSISYLVHAQDSYTVQGTVQDTVNYSLTQYTSVSLIRASDSVLVTFTRADEGGHFALTVDQPGAYLLLYEHPLFASVVNNVEVNQPHTDVGTISLTSRRILLKEVVINGRQAITIKGDTIEYAADSFKTGQYDNVDALLRQLPGLEVGPDGSIKAYGKTVEKMLVDGDEFFSDDPAMVAKMLRASAVDAVQVYDAKTDKAEFTGIDDGTRVKTVNLKLKENAKHGYFGKVMAGGGTDDYWQNEAMFNAFKKKRKISAYGIMSNTMTGGLSSQDARKYQSGNSGGMVVYNSGDGNGYGWNGNFTGQGLPKTWNGGLHYSNDWNDKLNLNSNYSIAKNDVSALDNTVTQYILPDTQYYDNHHSENYNSNIRHSVNVNGEYELDSLSSFRMRVNGAMGNSNSKSYTESKAQAVNGDLINENKRTQINSGENKNLNAYLAYRKKFKKKGRSLSANLSANINDAESDGILQSEYHLYAIDSTNTIDQKKINDNQNQALGLGISYTEPIVDKLYLLFNYNLNVNNQESQIQSFNQDPGGDKYDVLDSLYSNHYIYNILQNRAGLRFQYNPKEKFTMTVGGDVSSSKYTQEDRMGDSTIDYHYLNFYPSLTVRYRKSQQSSLYFNYEGRSQQPSMSQLQPVQNNEDPLNVAIGNPDLKQSFLHSFRMNYYNFKVLTSQSVFLNGGFSFEQNAITLKQNIDHLGKRTYQYVNVNGNYNANMSASYGRRIVTNLQGGIRASSNYSRTHNFINNQANTNNTWSLSPSMYLYFNQDTTLRIYYSFDPSYRSTVSEIRTDIKTNYWNFNQSLNATWQLPFRFKVGTDIQWEVRQQLSADDQNNRVFLWNAWFSRDFLKDHSLELKAYANDILNQNIGYSRVTTADQISERNYNTIQRYFMLSLTWNFTKTGASAGTPGQK